MTNVTKKESGFVFHDNFKNGVSTEWELVPYNFSRAVYTGSQLDLKHGASTLYLFLRQLQNLDEFVLDVKNNYNPTIENDVGGLIAFNDTKDFVALEEYFDIDLGVAESYPWLRLIKDHVHYSAYWSNNGVEWNFIGTNNLNAKNPKVGIFLDHDSGASLGVELVRVIKSNKVTVDNLQPGTKVTIYDTSNNVVDYLICPKYDNKVVFNTIDLPQPLTGRFVINTGEHEIDSGTNFDIYGGDYYTFEVAPEITFVKDGEEYVLESHVEKFLGYTSQQDDFRDVEIYIRNKMSGTFSNITLTLAESHNTDHYNRLVKLSQDTNTPSWQKTITIPSLSAGGEIKLLARLFKENNPLVYTPGIYFSLNVTASYSV